MPFVGGIKQVMIHKKLRNSSQQMVSTWCLLAINIIFCLVGTKINHDISVTILSSWSSDVSTVSLFSHTSKQTRGITILKQSKKPTLGTCLAVRWLRLCDFKAGGTCLILGRETKIPHTMWWEKNFFFFLRYSPSPASLGQWLCQCRCNKGGIASCKPHRNHPVVPTPPLKPASN